MASKEEVAQLKKSMQELRKGLLDVLIRLETLEDKVSALEGGEGIPAASGKPREPEPILTCVQCSAEYKESENAEGGCKYHSGELRWDNKYKCCNKGSQSYESACSLPGCTKGKHRSKHHTEYSYAAYYIYMKALTRNAKQLWLVMELRDHVTNTSEWAEVGLSAEDKVFIVVGGASHACATYAAFSSEELKKCKEPLFTALEISDSVGWAIRAEIQSSDAEANAITVSIKSASSSIPLVKRIGLYFAGDVPMPSNIECLSDPSPAKPSTVYTIPEPTYEGPVLDPGEDYSKDRKNDYETETTNDCPLKLQQHGSTEVASSTSKMANGKWNNVFTATVKVTNTSQANLAITDVYGEYMNEGGEWVRSDDQWIGKEGLNGSYSWFESTNFNLEPTSTVTLAARLSIAFPDDPPPSYYDGCRAHRSLPQPLHLRMAFVDQQNRTAALQFEQGNPPLPLATRESIEKKGNQVHFYLFADDVKKCRRSRATIYYDDSGVLRYRSVPYEDFCQPIYSINSSIADAAYNAKIAGKEEFELTDMKQEREGSTVQVFAVVNLEAGVAYALKVVITTPTSSATGYYLLPYDDASQASMTVEPQKVPVKGELTLNWSVPRASKSDQIKIYPRYGRSYVGYEAVGRDSATTVGSIKIKAPDAPGQYEVRYYPAWLTGNNTIYRHDGYWAPTTFTVTPAYHCSVLQPQ